MHYLSDCIGFAKPLYHECTDYQQHYAQKDVFDVLTDLGESLPQPIAGQH